MDIDTKGFLTILKENLSEESKWFLWVLYQEQRYLHKEEMRDLANNAYKKHVKDPTATLIPSRHGLDIHSARLEGAGLVEVKIVGRVRIYTISSLGKDLFKFMSEN